VLASQEELCSMEVDWSVGRSVGRQPATKTQYNSQLSALATFTARHYRHIYHVSWSFRKTLTDEGQT